MLEYVKDIIFITKWYFLGRLKIGRLIRKKQAQIIFNKYIEELKKGSLVIDAGANVGDFTKLFLDRGFKVIAFEPDPLAIKELKNKVKNDENLTLHISAIGLNYKTQRLFRYRKFDDDNPASTQGSSLLSYRSGVGKPSVEIQVIDFISFLKNLKEKIVLLKIDIEGTEIEILREIINHDFHNSIDKIFVETHERFSHNLGVETAKLKLRIKKMNIKNINLDWV